MISLSGYLFDVDKLFQSTKISTLRRQADENVTDTLGCQSNQWYLKFNNKNSIDQAATVGSFDSGDGFALFTAAKVSKCLIC